MRLPYMTDTRVSNFFVFFFKDYSLILIITQSIVFEILYADYSIGLARKE